MPGEYQSLLQHMKSYGFAHFEPEQELTYIKEFLQKLDNVLKSAEKALLLEDQSVLLGISLFTKTPFLLEKFAKLLDNHPTSGKFLELEINEIKGIKEILAKNSSLENSGGTEKKEQSESGALNGEKSEKIDHKQKLATDPSKINGHRRLSHVPQMDINVQAVKPMLQLIGSPHELGSPRAELKSPQARIRPVPPGFEHLAPISSPHSWQTASPAGPAQASLRPERSQDLQTQDLKTEALGTSLRPSRGIRYLLTPVQSHQLLMEGQEFSPDSTHSQSMSDEAFVSDVHLSQSIGTSEQGKILCPTPQRAGVDLLIFSRSNPYSNTNGPAALQEITGLAPLALKTTMSLDSAKRLVYRPKQKVETNV